MAKALHCLCWLAFFLQCIIVPRNLQVCDAYASRFIRPGHPLPFIFGPFQHGHPNWSVTLSATNYDALGNVSISSSSVGLDHMDQPSLPWPCPWFTTVPYLEPPLINTDHCRLGTPHTSCSCGDALPSRLAFTIWPSSNWLKSLHLLIFPASNTLNFRRNVQLVPNVSHPITGVMI